MCVCVGNSTYIHRYVCYEGPEAGAFQEKQKKEIGEKNLNKMVNFTPNHTNKYIEEKKTKHPY